jgi:hypothetical protein
MSYLNLISYVDNVLDRLVPYYLYSILALHVAYVFLFIGIVNFEVTYLDTFDTIIQLFICFFLIIRFNPLREHVFKKSDARVIFGSATFLLLNLSFVKLFKKYFKVPEKVLVKIEDKIKIP